MVWSSHVLPRLAGLFDAMPTITEKSTSCSLFTALEAARDCWLVGLLFFKKSNLSLMKANDPVSRNFHQPEHSWAACRSPSMLQQLTVEARSRRPLQCSSLIQFRARPPNHGLNKKKNNNTTPFIASSIGGGGTTVQRRCLYAIVPRCARYACYQ